MSKKSTVNTGVDICTVVFIVFLILKLTHVIDWSWWWVCSPLLIGMIPLVIALIILLPLFIKFKD